MAKTSAVGHACKVCHDGRTEGGTHLQWSCHGRLLKEVPLELHLRQLITYGWFSDPGTPST